jgi:uncharacterized membrane protein
LITHVLWVLFIVVVILFMASVIVLAVRGTKRRNGAGH